MRYSVRLHVLWRDGGFSNSLGALVCCNTWPKLSTKNFGSHRIPQFFDSTPRVSTCHFQATRQPYRKAWELIWAVKNMEIWRLGEKFSFFQFCAQNIDVKCFRASKTFQNVCKTTILCYDSYSLSVEDQKRKNHIFSKNTLQPPILVPNQWILLVKAAKIRYSVRLHVLWRDGGFSNSLGALVCWNTWSKVSAKKFGEPSDTSIFWQHP